MPNLSSYSLSQNDYDGETTTTTIIIPDMTVINTPVLLPAIGNFKDSIDAISMGVLTASNLTYERTLFAPPGSKATDKNAQRERKWLIKYYDAVTFRPFQIEVGCADASLLPATGTDTVNLRTGVVPAGVWTTFKTNFEALVDTPDGNDGILLEAILVGRNT